MDAEGRDLRRQRRHPALQAELRRGVGGAKLEPAFDASHQGESGGLPRLLENPTARVEDVRCAVDYLATVPYVDASRIGALGICAGSGYTIKAVTTERRVKAVATVSAVDTGASAPKGWEGNAPVSDQIATLEAVNLALCPLP